MEAQTVTWLVFLTLINHVSTSDRRNPFKQEPGELLATEGSCVEIKCQVTEDVDDRDADDDPYWFWMKDRRWVENDKDYTSTVIYSTNNLTRPVSPDFANRVKYIGSPSSSWKNSYSAGLKPLCSILICDLRTSDSGNYSLSFAGLNNWSSEEVTLNVEVNRCPLTFKEPAVVVESDVVTLTCSTSSSCPSKPHIQDVTQIDQTQVTGSDQDKERTTTFSFTASRQDDGREFSCQTQDNTDKYLIQNITVTVKYPLSVPKLSMSPEVTEGQTITINCTAESFPQSTLTFMRTNTYPESSRITENDLYSRPINSLSHTFTVTSADADWYFCQAENTEGSKESEWKELVVKSTGNYLDVLKFIVPALFVLMIIILIIVVLRFRRKKSIQQGTTNTNSPLGFSGWCNGTRRRSLTYENVSEQLRRPEAQRHQPLPDSMPPSDINAVYSLLNLPQAASAQNPTRQQAVNTKDDSANYAPVDFKNKLKKKQTKVEEDPVYAKVSKPTRVKKNEPESLQDYENISNATAQAPKYPNLFENNTSEGEVELNYSQVRFTATPQRQTTNRDSSSSEEDESLYSNVRI